MVGLIVPTIFLCRKRNHVLHSQNMTLCDSVMSIEFYSSYGTNVLENLFSARVPKVQVTYES